MDQWHTHVLNQIKQADIDRLLEITREVIHWEDIDLAPTDIAENILNTIEQIHADNK